MTTVLLGESLTLIEAEVSALNWVTAAYATNLDGLVYPHCLRATAASYHHFRGCFRRS
jgi:hypothetical protein